MTQTASIECRRAGYFTLLLFLINLVADGWSDRPSPLLHQLILIPLTAVFLWALVRLLTLRNSYVESIWTPRRGLAVAFAFELLFALVYVYEVHHFAALGYLGRPSLGAALVLPAVVLFGLAITRPRVSTALVFAATLLSYAAGMLLSILSFPLNYLRSDMLPVVLGADQNLLRHLSPYAPISIGPRIYDFPYLPGVILAYLPAAILGLDVRVASLLFVLATALLLFWAARAECRLEVTALLALFLLCPFVQYRHELYTQPHWFTLALIFVLMQRRRFAWAALAFGASMAIYQFSWILFPFFVLNAYRRRGWFEAVKLVTLSAVGALAIVGPFLVQAAHHISHNTVSQWGLLPHAQAEPMNLSFWVSYLIHPDKLLRLQAILMIAIFVYCLARDRCTDLADTLRWMSAALAIFILFNVLVDGYFYLMLLVVLLAYVCVANNWWMDPGPRFPSEPAAS